MVESETFRKGQALRRQLMGQAHTDRLDQTILADPIMKAFAGLVAETVWGAVRGPVGSR